MRVKYRNFRAIAYKLVSETYPIEVSFEDFVDEGTGEVVEFIQGGLLSADKFLIADDKTNSFIKVDVNDCVRINDDV